MSHAIAAANPVDHTRRAGAGLIICAAFAALWANWAHPLLGRLPATLVWIVVALVAAITAALATAGIGLIVRSHRARASAAHHIQAARQQRRTWTRYTVVVAIEVIALNIVAGVLFYFHVPQYLGPAIAIIVGLHFFPLARVFHVAAFNVTATLMTLAGTLAVLAIASGDSGMLAGNLAKLACALVLWGTGLASWRRLTRGEPSRASAVGNATLATNDDT